MDTVKAHFETWRPYTTTYVGLVGLAGATLAAPDPSGWSLLGAWAVPTLGWLAGLYGGDYFDRELDAIAKPHRPIPSGRMTARGALVAMALCVAIGAAAALALNWRTVFLVVAALVAGVSYSTFFKARGLSGNLVRGGLTAFAFLFGTMMTATYPPLNLLAVAGLFWLHDAGTNLVGALRDLDGDAEGGYQTLPVRRGVTVSLACATGLYALWLLIALTLPMSPGYAVMLGVAAALGASALVVVLRAPRPLPRKPALRAHEILVLERIVLACALLCQGAGPGFAVPLAVVAVSVTWLAQHYMRHRYEFAPTLGVVAGP
ncbi:UbiA family prenyltransferase [Amycolatopsis sp. cg5]|uniref:UbiA family prenyltransferase n=1 Tax=Amycolatopsis sp. cg5 TaxID=3238802 RepID=UPI003525B689